MKRPHLNKYFMNKKCHVCRGKAISKRYFGDKIAYLCESGACDRHWRDKNGFVPQIEIKKGD